MLGQAYSLASLNSRFTNQLSENRRMFQATQSFYRSFASASEQPRQKQTEVGINILFLLLSLILGIDNLFFFVLLNVLLLDYFAQL